MNLKNFRFSFIIFLLLFAAVSESYAMSCRVVIARYGQLLGGTGSERGQRSVPENLDRFLENLNDELTRLEADTAQLAAAFRSTGTVMPKLLSIRTYYQGILQLIQDIEAAEALLNDSQDGRDELEEMVSGIVLTIDERLTKIREELITLISANDSSVIVELSVSGMSYGHALDVLRYMRDLYKNVSKKNGLKLEPVIVDGADESRTFFKISGPNAGNLFAFESGIHRFEHFEGNKAQTKFVSVNIIEQTDQDYSADFRRDDIDEEVMRSSGHGGQNVQKTNSKVRLTHRPTGITVVMQNERSQSGNRREALSILRARVERQAQQRDHQGRQDSRERNVGILFRDRSYIRSYDLTQRRIASDVRTGNQFNFDTLPDNFSILTGQLWDQRIGDFLSDILRAKSILEEFRNRQH